MSYQHLTDNQLAEILLNAEKTQGTKSAQKKTDAAAEFFQRYCEKCDRRIRAILQSRGLEYSDANSYYNTVFFDLYGRIFEADNLIRKLRSYDVNRGVFERWLMRVVTSETIDWLRRVDPATGLSNALTVFPDTQVRSEPEEERGREGLAQNFPEKPSWVKDPAEEHHITHIRHILSQLSDELRVTMRLRFLSYCNLETRDLTYLSESLGRQGEEISADIENLQQDLRNSDAFLEAERQELELAVLTERAEYFH